VLIVRRSICIIQHLVSSQNTEIVTQKSFPSVLRYAAMTWNSDYEENNSFRPSFDVLLTVHSGIMLAIEKLKAQKSWFLRTKLL